MKNVFGLVLGVVCCSQVWAATLYVDLNSAAPAAPFDSWASAATNIQDAVHASADGDLIRIADGHYLLSSQISVTKAIVIQSVNGPESVRIDGQESVRCFNLGNAACVIEGLTITNGYTTGDGGGIYCTGTMPAMTNCMISGNSATDRGGGMSGGTANNCTISGNSADEGGGMYNGTANNCAISGNSATDRGGGMFICTANNCTISENSAYRYGGGQGWGTANNCTISENSANWGGGMSSGTANNCTISGNSAGWSGGGTYHVTANNCTISGNSATMQGGGARGVTVNNSIVWYNEAPNGNDLYYVTARYTCSPDLTHGANGNITNAPVMASASHITLASPCRGAGSTDYISGTDIDGEAWLNPPSMGCDELSGSVTGALSVGSAWDIIGPAPANYPLKIKALIDGAVSRHVWNFGDGNSITNNPYPIHIWNNTGTYDIVLTAYNDSWPAGVSATQTVYIVAYSEWLEMDADGDGYSNRDELTVGTDPYDPASVFALTMFADLYALDPGFVLQWNVLTGRWYTVLWQSSLTDTAEVLQDDLEYPQNRYTDTVHNAESSGFYRVEVRMK